MLIPLVCVTQKPKLSSDSEAAPKRGRRPLRRDPEGADKKKKPVDVRTECGVCKHSGTNANLVRYKSKLSYRLVIRVYRIFRVIYRCIFTFQV